MSEPKLTERQQYTLEELAVAVRVNPAGVWITCMLVGGTDGSHHSSTLAALCRKGLAKRTKHGSYGQCRCRCGPEAQFGHRCKGMFTYELTDAGREILRVAKGA